MTNPNVVDLDKKLGWTDRTPTAPKTVEAVMFGRSWQFVRGISDYHQMRLFMAAEPEAADIIAYLHAAVIEEQRAAWMKEWAARTSSIDEILNAVRAIAEIATSEVQAVKKPVKKAPARVARG